MSSADYTFHKFDGPSWQERCRELEAEVDRYREALERLAEDGGWDTVQMPDGHPSIVTRAKEIAEAALSGGDSE